MWWPSDVAEVKQRTPADHCPGLYGQGTCQHVIRCEFTGTVSHNEYKKVPPAYQPYMLQWPPDLKPYSYKNYLPVGGCPQK